MRARLMLMRNAHMFLKMKFPTKGVLATCSMAMWDHYIEWLFGDEVWNFTVKGDDGKPIACPHQGMVMAFDQACREKVARRMTEGRDIESAFDEVMTDMQLRNTALLAYFSTEVGTAKCKALSAPALIDIHGPSSHVGKPRALDRYDGEPQLTKRQRKAKAKAEKAAADKRAQQNGGPGNGGGKGNNKRKVLALQNGGVGDGSAKAAKGAAKGKSKSADGKPICFAYNNGQACRKTPCTFLHVCQVCGGDHPKTSPDCPKKQV